MFKEAFYRELPTVRFHPESKVIATPEKWNVGYYHEERFDQSDLLESIKKNPDYLVNRLDSALSYLNKRVISSSCEFECWDISKHWCTPPNSLVRSILLNNSMSTIAILTTYEDEVVLKVACGFRDKLANLD